jgi:hypothetical protein
MPNKLHEVTPDLQMVINFLVLLLVNCVVLLLANMILPEMVVLGTGSLSIVWALILSAGVSAWLGTIMIPLIHLYERYKKAVLKPVDWFVIYFVINFVVVWLVSRASQQFGLGVSSWVVVLVLAVVLDLVQGVVMMQVENIKKSLTK